MKRLLPILLFFILSVPAFAETPITVNIDSVPVEFDVEPRIIDGRTMVPVRAILEALDAEVLWDSVTKTVTATKDLKTISMTIGKREITVGENFMLMDTAPVIIGNRTLIPARFAAEVFENTVKWDAKTRTVSIISTEKPDIKYYKKYTGAGISLLFPHDWLLDESFTDTVFIDNQPTTYESSGLGMISISKVELVNSSFADTVSARYDYLLSDCGYNISDFKNTTVAGKNAALFKFVDSDGDYVLSYFIEGSASAYYIDFITDTENAFSDIFSTILTTVSVD